MIKYLAVFMIYFLFIWFSPVLAASIMDSIDMVIMTFKTLVNAEYVLGTGSYQLLVAIVSSIFLTCITFKGVPA